MRESFVFFTAQYFPPKERRDRESSEKKKKKRKCFSFFNIVPDTFSITIVYHFFYINQGPPFPFLYCRRQIL